MKIPKQAYTTEFKELVARRVRGGQSVSVVCKDLGMCDQTAQLGQGGSVVRAAGA